MEHRLVLSIVAISLIALALAILLPGGRTPEGEPRLPWSINLDTEGKPEVFGVRLGVSDLQQARDAFQEQGKLNLFRSPQGDYSAEAYFERLYLSGIRADVILRLAVDRSELERMFNRGLRISQLESGAKKIRLTEQDEATLGQAVIDHITYIPAANLDAELISSRFGEPARKMTEASGMVHWLYPEKGLDIALNPDGKEVFQYLIPADFEQVLAPLKSK